MNRATDIIAAAAGVVAAALTAVIFAVMLMQIWYRYFLNDSLLWAEDVCLWGLIWVVFLGGAVVLRERRHVNVPVFVGMLPERSRAVVLVVARLLSLAFLLFLAWLGFLVFSEKFHRMSPMLGLSTRWAKLAIPVGAALMVVVSVSLLIEDVRRIAGGGTDGGKGVSADDASNTI